MFIDRQWFNNKIHFLFFVCVAFSSEIFVFLLTFFYFMREELMLRVLTLSISKFQDGPHSSTFFLQVKYAILFYIHISYLFFYMRKPFFKRASSFLTLYEKLGWGFLKISLTFISLFSLIVYLDLVRFKTNKRLF